MTDKEDIENLLPEDDTSPYEENTTLFLSENKNNTTPSETQNESTEIFTAPQAYSEIIPAQENPTTDFSQKYNPPTQNIPVEQVKTHAETQEPELMGYYEDGTPTYAQAIEDNKNLVKERNEARTEAKQQKIKKRLFWTVISFILIIFTILLVLILMMNSANKSLKEQANQNVQNSQQINKNIKTLQEDVNVKKATIDDLNKKLDSTTKQLNSSRGTNKGKDTQVAALQKDRDNINQKLQKSNSELKTAQSKISQLEADLAKAENKAPATITVTETPDESE